MDHVEQAERALSQRLGSIEERLLSVEKRLNMPPGGAAAEPRA